MTQFSRLTFKNALPYATVLLVLFVSHVMVLHEPTRVRIKQAIAPDYRTVISKIEGSFGANEPQKTILKIKTNDGLIIEIYQSSQAGHPTLMDRIFLKDRRDAAFILHGEAVSLALEDVDQDNTPEIIVPTFDRDLVAHLQILKFNSEAGRLELVSN